MLTIASNYFLGATTFMTVLSSATIFLVTFGIVGLGVGMGAAFPRFKFENVTQIAGSAGGLLYMIASATFIAAVMFLEAVPVYLYLRAEFQGRGLGPNAIGIILAAGAAVVRPYHSPAKENGHGLRHGLGLGRHPSTLW